MVWCALSTGGIPANKHEEVISLMKIVVADPIYLPDAYRIWLEELGELEVFRTAPSSPEDFIERIKDAEIVIVGRYGFSKDAFLSAQKLKMISLWQTGYDNVDIKAATEHGVVVSNVPGYSFDAVAEFVFALALNLLRKVHIADARYRRGQLDCNCYVGKQLMGKTLGVIGTGDIGRRVIQIGHGFNMKVLSVTAHPNPEKEKELGVKFVDLDTLLSESDILTLHLPLAPSTEKMIGACEIAMMKQTAVLINTSRGRIIDEEALVEALVEKRIAGAGLDVFEKEPLPKDSLLLSLDNVVLTPHIAFLTEESIEECTYLCIKNVEMFLEGKAQNVVNSEVILKK
jgi:D-3-phosphoglycerate dehydrogenase